MNSSENNKDLALTLLTHIPKSVSEILLSDSSFLDQNNIQIEAHVLVGDGEISLVRSKLFSGIRTLYLDPGASINVDDSVGNEWVLTFAKTNDASIFKINRGTKTVILPDMTLISPNSSKRIVYFDEIAKSVNLPLAPYQQWRAIIVNRPLNDDEYILVNDDYRNTPGVVAGNIVKAMSLGYGNISELIPSSEIYYRRLIGSYDESSTIQQYEQNGLPEHIESLLNWKPVKGLLLALLLAGHRIPTALVDFTIFSKSEILEAYDWIASTADLFSQLGAVEIGLSIVDKYPEITPFLINIINSMKNEEAGNEESGFQLISSLIIVVDNLLSRQKIFSDKPPFYRRLASMAQASLIARYMKQSDIDIKAFSKMAMQQHVPGFFLQSALDLRQAPHWQPALMNAQSLKNLYIRRLIAAATSNREKIKDTELEGIILGTRQDELLSHCSWLEWLMPGPLEGEKPNMESMPAELEMDIQMKLHMEELELNSFAGAINSASIFQVTPNHAELISLAIKKCKYHVRNITNPEQLNSLLSGLAQLAAVTRNSNLAKDVVVMTRSLWLLKELRLSAMDALAIGLVAAAAYSELDDWAKFIGDWLTEISFQSLEKMEANILHTFCLQMCNREPALYITCGKANAALKSIVGI